MAIRCIDDLIDALRQLDLLSPSQMDVLVMSLRAGFVEPSDLAEDLVLKRWLTLFQAKEIFQGRADGLLLDRYVLLDRLGAGGMAVVFKAVHRHLGRVDAVKVMRPERLADSRVRRCFLHEAMAAARLSHPNVVAVYDAGETGARPFLAMEYVEGIDLEKLVRRDGPLPAALACAYVHQAALALQHIHEQGLVHRDVKPSNLLLKAGTDLVKLGDLGMVLVASLPREEEPDDERRLVMGTPDYVAPEQTFDPWGVDIRADLYSLGGTLYFLLAGRPPFPDGTATEKLVQHRQDEPADLGRLRQGLPVGLAGVVRRLMAKRPEARYQTPAAAAEALRPFSA
jgi:serine/threonine-protein kinase